MSKGEQPLVTGRLKEYIGQIENNRTLGNVVLKKKDIKWVEMEGGWRMAHLIHPMSGFDIKLHGLYMIEVPPGAKGPKHRHGDAAIYILSGKGYSIVDGKRYDYEAGDAAFMPAGVWHQQCNGDPDKPLVFLAAQGVFLGLILADTAEEAT